MREEIQGIPIENNAHPAEIDLQIKQHESIKKDDLQFIEYLALLLKNKCTPNLSDLHIQISVYEKIQDLLETHSVEELIKKLRTAKFTYTIPIGNTTNRTSITFFKSLGINPERYSDGDIIERISTLMEMSISQIMKSS